MLKKQRLAIREDSTTDWSEASEAGRETKSVAQQGPMIAACRLEVKAQG